MEHFVQRGPWSAYLCDGAPTPRGSLTAEGYASAANELSRAISTFRAGDPLATYEISYTSDNPSARGPPHILAEAAARGGAYGAIIVVSTGTADRERFTQALSSTRFHSLNAREYRTDMQAVRDDWERVAYSILQPWVDPELAAVRLCERMGIRLAATQ